MTFEEHKNLQLHDDKFLAVCYNLFMFTCLNIEDTAHFKIRLLHPLSIIVFIALVLYSMGQSLKIVIDNINETIKTDSVWW